MNFLLDITLCNILFQILFGVMPMQQNCAEFAGHGRPVANLLSRLMREIHIVFVLHLPEKKVEVLIRVANSIVLG